MEAAKNDLVSGTIAANTDLFPVHPDYTQALHTMMNIRMHRRLAAQTAAFRARAAKDSACMRAIHKAICQTHMYVFGWTSVAC